ncbi:nitroreductase family protein [Dysgonomonas sp. 520]|uniref:nitroreductase family protein n=1 Tax=Dysgonomonas sp. 520 TaxID=2302931 RepID=UPI0013D7156E|nr:nitroreductase family protein [Dysgonomonas sp. 520]
MSLLESLNWRYATKRMNGDEVSQENIDKILETIRLAPTSMGLQAFKVFVIKDKKLIKKIEQEAAPRQLMLDGCSRLLVFAAYTKVTDETVDEYVEHISEVRQVPLDSLATYRARFQGIIDMTDEQKVAWTSRQVYIAMAYASIAAARLGVDSTPVEGFDHVVLNKILNLSEKDLTSVLLLPLGYRDEETDSLVHLKKVRKDSKDLFIEL